MGFKRRTKADIAITVLRSDLGQNLLDAQAREIEKQLRALEVEERALRGDLDSINRLRNGGARNGRSKNGRRRGRQHSVDPQIVLAGIGEATQTTGVAPTIGQLSKQLGQKPAQLRPALRKLIEDQAVKKTGERRGTRYSLL